MALASRLTIAAAYIGMCLIWGTTWLGIKISLQTLGPIMGVGIRFTIAGLFLYVVAAATRSLRPLNEVPWRVVVVLASLLFGTNYVLNYIAETRLDSGLVSVLFGVLPFFTFAFSRFMIGEKATAQNWIGAVVAFCGVAIISLGGAVRGSPIFALCSIAAAAIAAYANVYAKKHSHHPPLVTLPPSMLLAGGVLVVLGFFFERTNWAAVVTPTSIGALLYLAILGSSIAFFLMLWLLQRIPVWSVGISTLVFPVIAVIVGYLFGGEHMEWRELLGSAIVAGIGVALAPRSTGAEMRSDTA